MEINELKELIRAKTLKKESTDLLKYILGESERYSKAPVAVIEKLIVDNKSTFDLVMNSSVSDEKKKEAEVYLQENEKLSQYLPKYITVEEIVENLGGLSLDQSGKSIGMAIKVLNGKNLTFKKEDVPKALKLVAGKE
jgi:hypothetical protein